MITAITIMMPALAHASDIINGSFEIPESTADGRPGIIADWSGDDTTIVGTENGILPYDGNQMLRFRNTNAGGPGALTNASEIYQLIDVTDLRAQIDSGLVTLNAMAYVNRIANTNKHLFSVKLFAHAGPTTNFPSATGLLAYTPDNLRSSDDDPFTWEAQEATLDLPVGTEFVAVAVFVSEYPENDATDPEFPGHYTDLVSVKLEVNARKVAIDVKPGSDPNCFNLNGHGVIPVAILGTADFDATQIDIDSAANNPLSFNGLSVRVRGKKGPLCTTQDINLDGYTDLVCHFEDTPDEWLEGDEVFATLTGSLLDGTPIEGTDSICIRP
jgi:hypothetical protein